VVENVAASHAEYLAEGCRAAWDGYRQHQDAARARQRALEAKLDPSLHKELEDLVDAVNGATTEWAAAGVAELTRHFPGVAPALGIVWKEHVIRMLKVDNGRCCVTQDPAQG
jgi:hypothetical protein